jgi:hypothetical protein
MTTTGIGHLTMTKNQIKQEVAQEISEAIIRFRDGFGIVISAASRGMLTLFLIVVYHTTFILLTAVAERIF